MSLQQLEGPRSEHALCPVCAKPVHQSLYEEKTDRTYFTCSHCGFIFLSQDGRISGGKEKSRYLRHRNGMQEKGYVEFLTSFLKESVIPRVKPGARVLDFGSGPVPVFSWLLQREGYQVDSFDIYFCPDRGWEKKHYQAIILMEVLEHISDPMTVLEALKKRLLPGGFIFIRTGIHFEDVPRFDTWWYRQDPTHIAFFSIRTIRYAAAALKLRLVSLENNRDIILQRDPSTS